MMDQRIDESVYAIFQRAARVSVLTGAGISAESGVPTFRSGGQSLVWRGYPFEQLSSVATLARNPTLVWEWFNYRREIISRVEPNAAHRALAQWQDDFEQFTLITQNIDGLHWRAGSRDVIELHGNIWRVVCQACGQRSEYRQVPLQQNPPRCSCTGLLRPDVVLFGEMLPEEAWQRAVEAASACDLFIVVGTSAVVYPAAQLPVIAKQAGAYLLEINPETTPLTPLADTTILGKAAEILPRLSKRKSTH
ncbi:MAG: NAD-dependent deacylase [Acidobacteriota bacterium]|nr:NAD-dependent deacylase [Acidobacteriota bacterium]